MTLKLISEQISSAANKFNKMAQMQVQVATDPLAKAMNATIGKKVEQLFVSCPSISEAQFNIKFTPPSTAEFLLYSNGTEEDKTKLTNELNTKFAPTAAKVMAKYQKDAIDWKWTTFQKSV